MSRKPCADCGRVRPLRAFGPKADNPDGHESRCRDCRARRARDHVCRARTMRKRYPTPPWPTGRACACGYRTRNGVCLNCGLVWVIRVRTAT